MSLAAPLKTHTLSPLLGSAPDSIVIFLHGLGDSGSGGLLEICRLWQHALPHTIFFCPDAPFAFDMAPADFGGRQWFSLREFSKKSVDTGVKNAMPILNNYIDHMLSMYHLKPTKLVLIGFSQGTMMALHAALRRDQPIAGVIGYSGMLADAENLSTEKKSSPPVLLIHGTEDEVVPFMALKESERALTQNGIAVETLACSQLAHSIDQNGVAAGLAFLKKVFSS